MGGGGGGGGALSIVLLGALYMAVVHVHMECQGGDYLYYLHMGFMCEMSHNVQGSGKALLGTGKTWIKLDH